MLNRLGICVKLDGTDNARLVAEVESLVAMHQDEINLLQRSIADAQNAANSSESNLTAIGQYVDTLEQRLASFAIIRRDVELREQKCKEIEEQTLQLEQERDNLRTKIEEFEVEQSDLKALFEDLVDEQTNLRAEKAELIKERDSLLQGAQRSREALASLEVNMKRRDEETDEWRSKALEFENELNATKGETAEIQKGVQDVEASKGELQKQVDSMQTFSKELQSQLDAKTAEISALKEQLEAKAFELLEKQQQLVNRAAELRNITAKLELREEELKKQGAELSMLQTLLKQKAEQQPSLIPQQSVNTNTSKAQVLGGEKVGNSSVLNATANQNTTSLLLPLRSNFPANGKPPPAPANFTVKTRKIPFRQVRKFFAKTTGVHGAFTRQSKKDPPEGHRQPNLPNSDQQRPPPPSRRDPPKVPPRIQDLNKGAPSKSPPTVTQVSHQGVPPRNPSRPGTQT
jgi:peptidoglycan hydrolase CwlO-like protein